MMLIVFSLMPRDYDVSERESKVFLQNKSTVGVKAKGHVVQPYTETLRTSTNHLVDEIDSQKVGQMIGGVGNVMILFLAHTRCY